MSLAISASKEYEHYIAVDTAISFEYKGIIYRNEDNDTELKIRIIDGEAYFFSGDYSLVLNTQILFEEQTDRSFNKLTEIAQDIFEKYAEEGDKLAFSKYGFDTNGLATLEFNNSEIWSKTHPVYYGDPKNVFISYGANMQAASKELNKYLNTVDITPDFFIPIYEAVCNEGVGGNIIVYHLTQNKCRRTVKIPLTEPKTIRKATPTSLHRRHLTFVGSGEDAFPIAIHGEGDGAKNFGNDNVISPEMAGEHMSGRGFLSKPNGSFDMLYYNSNYGKERSLRLKDDEVLMKSEGSKIRMLAKNFEIEADQGGVKIMLSNGSSFELTPEGDVTLHAKKDIKVSADGNVQISAQKYDFA
ncbi:hypothetical protein PMSD_05050 [Paenibacillus macquariensis subsp. defensor]|nr:hypothetical protein PMSD_05050 [Paenibacillus macquariensis subsp. defensor]